MSDGELFTFGFTLILVGVALLILAAFMMAMRGKGGSSETKATGVIMIGPVPIIFGSDKKNAKTLMLLGTILTALLVAGMLIYYWLLR